MDALINSFRDLKNDISLSGTMAGLIVVLVGLTSSAVLIFQAASVVGLTPSESSSWLGSVCFGMGLLTIIFSMRYKAPVLMAWSTAGAAILVTGLKGVIVSDAIGAFLFSAFLIFLFGITGLFEKLMNKIPMAIASALLAGVLLHFSLDSFVALKTQPLLVGLMFLTYVISKKLSPRSTMMFVLIVGMVVSASLNLLHFSQVELAYTQLHFVMPTFSLRVLLSIGVPLFVVTMASQNLTGIAVMRANNFHTPISPILTWSGIVNFLLAPFGGFAINLAAITAAIAMGVESHPQPEKRYYAAVFSGVIYMIIGIFAGTVTSLFAAFPREMVAAVTGLALFATIASCLQKALMDESQKESAFVTFALTASGLSLFGIGPAFWGLIAGILTQFVLQSKTNKN